MASSEAQRTLRTINGRSRLQFDKTQLVAFQNSLAGFNSDILQLEEDITSLIPQSEKADFSVASLTVSEFVKGDLIPDAGLVHKLGSSSARRL